MVGKVTEGYKKRLVQPVASLTLMVFVTTYGLPPGLAQSPAKSVTSPETNDSTTVQTSDAYTLGAGDRVRVDVFKVARFSGENQVLVDGTLNLPEIGNVSVEGLTLREASDAISTQYSKLLKYPLVTLTLLAPRPVKVAVSGEVNRPGSYTIPTTDVGSQLPTVTRALQLAGGITQVADLRNVEVRRPQRGGGDQVLRVNLWDFLQSGDQRRDISLRSGDTIMIPTVKTTSLTESVQLASASFAADRSQPLNIAVVGEVYRPGPYTVSATARTGAAGETGQTAGGGDRPPTITRAIQVAGGIKPQADIRKIQVRRMTRSGTEKIIDIDLWKLLQTGDINQDLILQDRDTVVIPMAKEIPTAEAMQIAAASFSPDTIRVNVVGEVKQPGVLRVPPNTPLNQAILAAGGFNVRAFKRSVELVRLNSDGTVTRRSVRLDLDKGVDEDGNPSLRNDDIVIVNRSALATVSDNLNAVITPINSFLSILSIYSIFRR
ncbi:MAG: SLBB domain-containing protein [Oscillatoriales cyanobacterium C42_A2020_001]|nr:SLBB domain-containing protein [Leptolyngbyaceae cyanobacterium C42_A2020_001]